MVYSSSRTVSMIISFHVPLITILIIKSAVARELRPSEHGLEYQSPPPETAAGTPPEMLSFFKGSSSPSTSNSSSSVALPRAMNSNDTSWWNADVHDGGGGRDHVRHVMLVVSLVCGVTGLALLIACTFIYVLKYQNRQSSASSCVNNNFNTNNNNNNKIQ